MKLKDDKSFFITVKLVCFSTILLDHFYFNKSHFLFQLYLIIYFINNQRKYICTEQKKYYILFYK